MQGKSNKEIARSLKLAEGTVKIHVDGLFSKLGGVWGRARRRESLSELAVEVAPAWEGVYSRGGR
jgi:ATP/maltotriose-dependent transcriptional regulator MalT